MILVFLSTFLKQGYKYPGRQDVMASEFCTVVPNICGPSVWNLLDVTLLAARILKWLLGFWKVCSPLF
jgi:hypothetical protein